VRQAEGRLEFAELKDAASTVSYRRTPRAQGMVAAEGQEIPSPVFATPPMRRAAPKAPAAAFGRRRSTVPGLR